jgi:hypothetical protein
MTYSTSDLELNVPLLYMETTIPVGMTITEYRVSRPAKPSLRDRVRNHLRTSAKENR